MIGLIGKKLGQSRVYTDDGSVVCVTAVLAGPNRVLQCKTVDSDGYDAVQLGFDDQKEQRVNKPMQGHCKKAGASAVKRIREFRDYSLEVKPGDTVGVDAFAKGDFVDVIGVTKGRGFQGVMKRWDFAGGPASHGQKGFSRRPGGIAQGSTPGWVAKGKKMPGHMGQKQRTVQNLEVIDILAEDNVILVKGALPGAAGDYIIVRESKKKTKAAAK